MSPQVSVFTPYSIGVVAANKPVNSHIIEVTPIETLPMTDGELTDNLKTIVESGTDSLGAAYEATIKSSITHSAEWLALGSNRKTSPDVRRGEMVIIYRFGDADKYYWTPLKYNPDLRKLETVVYSFSGTTKESAKADDSNTYFMMVSTHNKLVQFHTSTDNGEPVGYDFIFNTADSNVQLTDTKGNSFFLDSDNNRLVLITAGGAVIDLNNEDLNFKIPGNVTGDVGGNWGVKIGGSSTWSIDGKQSIKASETNYITEKFTTSSLFQTGGNAIIGGGLTLTKGMQTGAGGSEGDIEMKGTLRLDGALIGSSTAAFTGRVTASNIS